VIFQQQILAVVGATLVGLHLSSGPASFANRDRPPNSGRPPELINQPICWSPEEPDPSQYCGLEHNG
jgi:hypothetical protein